MTDKEDAFGREVLALERYDRRNWLPRYGEPARDLTYTDLAAYFREIARRAMTCAFRAEEAAQETGEGASEPITGVPKPGWE